jgi:hypothetical protein
MSVEEKEVKVIKLNDERSHLIKLVKTTKPENAQKYIRRIEEINHEIEELIYG